MSDNFRFQLESILDIPCTLPQDRFERKVYERICELQAKCHKLTTLEDNIRRSLQELDS